jgi:hypothetical protein
MRYSPTNMTYLACARTCARWCSAISTARALSRFVHYKGANHRNDRLTISTDEEDWSTSWRATPGSDTERQQQPQQQQQHLLPPSPDDQASRRGLAGLAVTGTSWSPSSSPM